MTFDIEEWFCAHNLSPQIQRNDWETCELRAMEGTLKLLDLLDRRGTHATFFMLGWIMERVPDLAAEILRRGHELASHGYAHRKVTEQSADEFRGDLDRALELHVRQHNAGIYGYRAPSFTLTDRTRWIVPILESRGLLYSSSVFPVRGHPVYGIPDAPLVPWRIGESLIEVPLTVAEVAGQRIPCGGGAYLRLYPFRMTRLLLRLVRSGGRNLNLYVHPWETDPLQPRIDIPFGKRLRHYHNLERTLERLDALLSEFHLTSIREFLCII